MVGPQEDFSPLELPWNSSAHDRADWYAIENRVHWTKEYRDVHKYDRDLAPLAPGEEETIDQIINGQIVSFATSNLFLGGYRILLNHITSPLCIILHILRTHPSPSESVAHSPFVRNLLLYANADVDELRYRVGIWTAPKLWEERPRARNPLPDRKFLRLILPIVCV